MKHLGLKSILAIICCSYSLGIQANVFGKDDRQMLSQDAFNSQPISMIVKIGPCTGALVGPNLVLTAYHCIKKKVKNDEITRKISVRAGAYESKRKAKAKAIRVVSGGESGTSNDWAVLVLDKSLGSQFGYFKVRNFVNYSYDDINLAGYSSDRNNRILSLHKNCSITRVLDEQFLHNCDSTGGASGAPLWRKNDQGEYELVALHFGGRREPGHRSRSSRFKADEYSHELANVAVRPLMYADAVLDLL